MENHDQQMETTVDIYVSTSGSARISVETFTDENLGVYDDKDVLKFTQTVLLNTGQSRILYEQLKEHFEHEESVLTEELTLPEEPKEAGWYLTQSGEILRKDRDDEWSFGSWIFKNSSKKWSNDGIFTRDWALVVSDLGNDAFPLEHITEEYLIELARYIKEE